MTVYPNNIDSIITLPTVAGSTPEDIAINDLQPAVIAIETELGLDPKGIYSDVATRLSILESRIGPGPGSGGGAIDINTQTAGVLSVSRGGTALNAVGAINTVLTSTGTNNLYALILNANVDPSAAIAGTKIVPTFGTQFVNISGISPPSVSSGGTATIYFDSVSNKLRVSQNGAAYADLVSSTVGTNTQIIFNDGGAITGNAALLFDKVTPAISIGTTVATSGLIRIPNNKPISARNAGNTADFNLAYVDASNYATYGTTGATVMQMLQTAGGADWSIATGAGNLIRLVSNVLNTNVPIAFGATPATIGTLRLSNTNQIVSRDSANTADIVIGSINASNGLYLGMDPSGTNQASIAILNSASETELLVNNVAQLVCTAGSVQVWTSANLILGGGLSPASSGRIAMNNNDAVKARNAGNTADIQITLVDASNNVNIGDGTNSAILALTSGTGALKLQFGGTDVFTVDSTTQITSKAATAINSANTKCTVTEDIANVQTVDATVTSAFTWTIPNGVSQIDVIVTAIKSDNTQGASYKRAVYIRNNAGTVAFGTVIDNGTVEDDPAWDCTIDNTTTTGRVRVTGVAATTIQWDVCIRRQEGIA